MSPFDEITHLKTLNTSDAFADLFYLFSYWNGGAPQTQTMYVDDIIVTSQTPTTKDAQGNPYIGMGETIPPEQPGSEPSNGNGGSSNGNGGSSNGGGTSVASNLTPGDNGSEEAYEGEAEEIINLTTPPEKEEPTRFIDIFKDNQLLSIIVIILLILTLLVIYWVVKYYKRPARKRSRRYTS